MSCRAVALAVLAAMSAVCGQSSEPPEEASEPTPGPRLYVSNETDGNVVVVDAADREYRNAPVGGALSAEHPPKSTGHSQPGA